MTEAVNGSELDEFLPGVLLEPVLRDAPGKSVSQKVKDILRMTREGPYGPFRNAAIVELGPEIAENRHLLVLYGFCVADDGRQVWFDGGCRPVFSLDRSWRPKIEDPSATLPSADSDYLLYDTPHHVPDKRWARIIEEIRNNRLLAELKYRFSLAETAAKRGVNWTTLWKRGD